MRPPCELLQSELLTGMRALIAINLRKQEIKKFSQSKIANILQISQPVIHAYLKLPEEELLKRYPLLMDPSVQENVDKIVDEIVNDASSSQLIQYICSTCYHLRVRGPICVLHRKITSLDQNCQLCLP
ncbi:MAG: transcriptional regulator, partial [Candidatus Hodarchaeota archaeon]